MVLKEKGNWHSKEHCLIERGLSVGVFEKMHDLKVSAGAEQKNRSKKSPWKHEVPLDFPRKSNGSP